MSDIDLPSLKDRLWHHMRTDLIRLVPWFRESELLLCPVCCRPLGFDDFSVEHIVPQQALAADPIDVRQKVPQNERAGTILLCKRPLIFNGKTVRGNGCNGWKGRHYDSYLRKIFLSGFTRRQVNSRHQIALFSAAYLGLFREFGYQVALSSAGSIMRRQFFAPNSFNEDVPTSCQMMLTGAPNEKYDADTHAYWAQPFKITTEKSAALVVVRNLVVRLPLSRDPSVPLAQALPYAPARYKFRPDFRSII